MPVRVTGIRELQRAARAAGGEAPKLLRARLKRVGELVRDEAASKVDAFNPGSEKTASGYRVYVRQRGVSVEQSRRKTTGQRGDWGGTQMRLALVPALEDKEEATRDEAELALDDIARIFAR